MIFPTMRRIVQNLLKQLGFENIDEAPKTVRRLTLKWKRGGYGFLFVTELENA